MTGVPLVQVENLSKLFYHGGRQLPVLREIDLSIQHGEMVSVVGKSGVGKSTLLHVLGTIDLPTAGKIKFEGRDITGLTPSQLADFRNRTIGFVFQFHHLLPEFTAVENVMMPLLIRRVPRARAEHKAQELLDAMGLKERLTHRPGELSGGEQQRVALARAVVMEPKLLLADEPTGNLDTATGEATLDLFFELNRKFNMAMMIVTHNADLADRMPRNLRMVDGRLEELGRGCNSVAAPGVQGAAS